MNVFGRVLILLCFMPLGAIAQDAPDPHETVKEATDKLLNKLAEVKPLYESDREAFYREVEDSLAPFVDFEGFARGVMAKYYRRASDVQRAQFVEKFQNELIRTYSNALVEFDNQKVEVEPLSEAPNDGRATVDIKVYGKDGSIYPVSYTLALIDGNWKLRNVVVDGINIGLQFRSQFSNYMQKYRNDIDKVIDNWDVERQDAKQGA